MLRSIFPYFLSSVLFSIILTVNGGSLGESGLQGRATEVLDQLPTLLDLKEKMITENHEHSISALSEYPDIVLPSSGSRAKRSVNVWEDYKIPEGCVIRSIEMGKRVTKG